MSKRKPELVFDFDGTIADTYDFVFDIAEDVIRDFHIGKITPEMVDTARDLPMKEALKYLGFSGFRLFLASKRFQKYLYDRMDHLKPVTGIKEVLMELSKEYTLGLLSMNGGYIINEFLEKFDLNYFDYVVGSATSHGKHRKIKRLLRRRKLKGSEFIYFGDEVRDIVASKKAGVKVVAVTWGYNSIKALKEYDPDYLVYLPDEILRLDFIDHND